MTRRKLDMNNVYEEILGSEKAYPGGGLSERVATATATTTTGRLLGNIRYLFVFFGLFFCSESRLCQENKVLAVPSRSRAAALQCRDENTRLARPFYRV